MIKMSEHRSVEVIKDVHVPIRDGVHLAAYIVRPSCGEKYPAIIIRMSAECMLARP